MAKKSIKTTKTRSVIRRPVKKSISLKKEAPSKAVSTKKDAKSLVLKNKVQTAAGWKKDMIKKMKG